MSSIENLKRSLGCVVPARNEAGHLEAVIAHILKHPKISRIVICEGGSTDDTWGVAQAICAKYPQKMLLIKQSGTGKANAVLEAAQFCKTDLILIWDADGTVSNADTERIIEMAVKHSGGAIVDRLRGNMAKGSMRFANLIGNWCFAFMWSPLTGRKPSDMLCGTKVFPSEVFLDLPQSFSKYDPYGDFALMATALRKGFIVNSVVVDYDARTYGQSNIHRWSGGMQLLRFTLLVYFMKYFRRKIWHVN